jgi:hypothetical protein
MLMLIVESKIFKMRIISQIVVKMSGSEAPPSCLELVSHNQVNSIGCCLEELEVRVLGVSM